MKMIECKDLFSKMDKAGAAGQPFLFAVDYELEEGLFVTDPLSQSEILFDIEGITNCERPNSPIPSYLFEKLAESYEVYSERFQYAMEALKAGRIALLNLTIKTPLETSLSLRNIFDYGQAKYRLFVPHRFTCFSPERFVRIEGGKISSHPMKGTIDANIPDAMERLLGSEKELREHETTVVLASEDLSRVASGVEVKRFRYVDRVQTHHGEILQSSSEVVGTLPEDYRSHLGEIIANLLPSGSILGHPRDEALKVIEGAEGQKRGFYSGIAGYFDGEVLETFVLIRFIEEEEGQLYYRSGGGVTVNSNCKSEYEEALRKVYLPF